MMGWMILRRMKRCLPYLPFAAIVIGILLISLTGVRHELTFKHVAEQHQQLLSFVTERPVLAPLMFVGVYILSVCFVIPDSIFLSILAGFLFPYPLAVIYIVFSETIGAWLFFEATHTALRPATHKIRNRHFSRLKAEISLDQANYLLFCRFSHLFPFWLVNTAAAVVPVKRWTFIWTTALGVLPFAFVLAEGGKSLAHYFKTHAHFTIDAVFTTDVKLMLVGFGVLALVPVLWKRARRKRA